MHTYKYVRDQLIPGTKYNFIRKLGEGGSGEVYEVECDFPRKRYVMKVALLDRISPGYVSVALLEEGYRREAQILARLDHPNIVDVLPGGMTAERPQPRPYFIMKRMLGRSLADAIEAWGRAFDVRAAIGTLIPVLEAVAHAHGKGIVHRDLKPENIFLQKASPTNPTHVTVIDFGIAHVVATLEQDAEAAFKRKRFMGTMRWAAPEQIRGDDPTSATDIHAVGLILYRMLANRGPFDEFEAAEEGESEAQRFARLARAILEESRPPVSYFVQGVPPELDALLLRMLDPDPAKRPGDAKHLIDDLRGIVNRMPIRLDDATVASDHDTEDAPIEALLAGTHGNLTDPNEWPVLHVTPAAQKTQKTPQAQQAQQVHEHPFVAPPPPPRVFSTQNDPRPPHFTAERSIEVAEVARVEAPAPSFEAPEQVAHRVSHHSSVPRTLRSMDVANKTILDPPVREHGPRRWLWLLVCALTLALLATTVGLWRVTRPWRRS